MRGGAAVHTVRDDSGRTRIAELSASAPLGIKRTGPTDVHLIGTAAAPLDGDEVTILLTVEAGTQLTVQTVAATMAWPARGRQAPSVMRIHATVGAGAVLRWLPEPLVPVQGCHHELRCTVELAPTASLLWREELVLGRAGEEPGQLHSTLRVIRGAVPLLHQELAIDGRHQAPSVLGSARATGTLLAVGPEIPEHSCRTHTEGLRGAVLELEAGGRLATATASSAVDLRRWLDARMEGLASPHLRLQPAAGAGHHPARSEALI